MSSHLGTSGSACQRLTKASLCGRSAAAFALAIACGSEAPPSPAPGSTPGSMAGTSGQAGTSEPVDPHDDSGAATTPAEVPGITWAAAPGPATPELDLNIVLGMGPSPLINAAGDMLTWGVSSTVLNGEERNLPLLTRLNRDGEVLWSHGYASEASLFPALQADGGVLVAGGFRGRLNLGDVELESWRNRSTDVGSASSLDETYGRGDASSDLVVFRLSADGALSWARRYGDGGDQAASAATLSATGELVVVGQFVGALSIGEHRLVSRGGGARRDLFIARFDAAGNPLSLAPEDPMYVDAIAMDAEGALWVAGHVLTDEGPVEGWLLKIGADGRRQWRVPTSSGASSLALDGNGAAYLAFGALNSEALVFGQDTADGGVLAKVSAQGEVVWQKAFAADFLFATLAVDALGNVGMAGGFRSRIDFGAGVLATSGSLDMDLYFASFSPDASLRYSLRLGSAGFDGVNGGIAASANGWLVPFYLENQVDSGNGLVSSGQHLMWVNER
jgi:hypothetical protein